MSQFPISILPNDNQNYKIKPPNKLKTMRKLAIGWTVRAGQLDMVVCLLRKITLSTLSLVASSQGVSRSSSTIILLSCFNNLTPPYTKLLTPTLIDYMPKFTFIKNLETKNVISNWAKREKRRTWKEARVDQAAMDTRAEASDGSVVADTTKITIFHSKSCRENLNLCAILWKKRGWKKKESERELNGDGANGFL